MSDLADATRRRIDSLLGDWLADADVPGAGLAVVDPDGVRYATGYGARDLASNAPATAETLFGVGSVTKSVTALAVLQLAEAGAFDLGDPVADHVDRFADTGITVRDLLTHSSGMPSDGMAVGVIARTTGAAATTAPGAGRADFDRLLEATADDRVTDGDPFFYYNSGYTVLGDLVEAVADRPFDGYVRERILRPLGMDRATFREAAFETEENAQTSYYKEPGGDGEPELVEASFPFAERSYAPGGLVASARELASYLRLHLNGGELDGDRLIGADALAEAHEAHATRQTFLDGREQGYGYGWMRQALGDDVLVGHGGSVSVSTAFVGFLEDAEVGVALACNTSADPHPMHVGPAVLALLAGREPEEVVPYYRLDAKLSRVEGAYESVHGVLTADVERHGGTLRLSMETDLGERGFDLVPESLDGDDLTFTSASAAGAEVPVRFGTDADGEVADLFVQRWRLKKVD